MKEYRKIGATIGGVFGIAVGLFNAFRGLIFLITEDIHAFKYGAIIFTLISVIGGLLFFYFLGIFIGTVIGTLIDKIKKDNQKIDK